MKDFLRRIASLVFPRLGRLELSYILAQAESAGTLPEKIFWFEGLIQWVRSGPKTGMPHEFDLSKGAIQNVRIRFLLHLLARQPQWKSAVAENLRGVISQTSGLRLFCQAGISQESGFFSEAADRILKKILPAPPHHRDLSELFFRVFTEEDDALWIAHLSPEIISQLESLIQFEAPNSEKIFISLQDSMSDALLILGSRVCALGLSEEIRMRLPEQSVAKNSFFKLQKRLDDMIESENNLMFIDCQGALEASRRNIKDVFLHLEESGVSTQIVYRLESLTRSLNRIEMLLRLLSVSTDVISSREVLIPRFLSELVRDNLSNRNALDLAQSNLHLLARKVVERTGASGEHYITRDRKEYRAMLRSAAGGGFVSVFTTLFKFVIIRMQLAVFFEGLFHWINYTATLSGMQFLGFTLATKQPSMTASSLAVKLRHLNDAKEMNELVDEVARITRSQFAAVIGNVGMVIPTALVFDLAFKGIFGHHVLNEGLSQYYVRSLNPFGTLTIFHGAITGFALWFSSVAGGWLENWVVFRQIPEAIAQHRRLQQVFGQKRCERLSKWFLHNISGIGINVALGFCLAFIPIFGHLFGLPLEAKHVTLSAGALTFSICTLWSAHSSAKGILLACLGVVFVGIMNFGVSFALSLFVAARAREVRQSWIRNLLKAVRARLRKNPGYFFLSPE